MAEQQLVRVGGRVVRIAEGERGRKGGREEAIDGQSRKEMVKRTEGRRARAHEDRPELFSKSPFHPDSASVHACVTMKVHVQRFQRKEEGNEN